MADTPIADPMDVDPAPPSPEPSKGTPAEPAKGTPAQPEPKQEPASKEPAPEPVPDTPPSWWEQHVQGEDLQRTAQRYASPTDAVRALVEARREISQRVRIPGEDASDEDIKKFRQTMGVPETPDGYKYERPSDLPDYLEPDEDAIALEQDFLKHMHEAHTPQPAVQAAIDWYYRALSQAAETQRAADKQFADESEATLRKELGPDFDRFKKAADTALSQFGAEETDSLRQIEMKDGRFLLDHPTVLKLLGRIGTAMSEGRPGVETMPAEQQQTIRQRISELQQRRDYWSDEVQTEVQQLWEKLEGTQAIKGTAGPITGPPRGGA